MNENAEEILAINNNSNIQLEFINVKNISQDGVEFLKDSENLVIENENLKKELEAMNVTIDYIVVRIRCFDCFYKKENRMTRIC